MATKKEAVTTATTVLDQVRFASASRCCGGGVVRVVPIVSFSTCPGLAKRSPKIGSLRLLTSALGPVPFNAD